MLFGECHPRLPDGCFVVCHFWSVSEVVASEEKKLFVFMQLGSMMSATYPNTLGDW